MAQSADGPAYASYVTVYDRNEAETSYNDRYRASPRESDKILLDSIAGELSGAADPSVLDICCGTGNLLHHLKQRHSGARFVGIDLAAGIIEKNRKDPDLSGMEFAVVDVIADNFAEQLGTFQVAVTNAATQSFDQDQLAAFYTNVGNAVRPGGLFINFDCYQPYFDSLSVNYTSPLYRDGLIKHYHSYMYATAALEQAGFTDVKFEPFEISIDLPGSKDRPADVTRTVQTADGKRLQFIGAVHQPWCFLTARRK